MHLYAWKLSAIGRLCRGNWGHENFYPTVLYMCFSCRYREIQITNILGILRYFVWTSAQQMLTPKQLQYYRIQYPANAGEWQWLQLLIAFPLFWIWTRSLFLTMGTWYAYFLFLSFIGFLKQLRYSPLEKRTSRKVLKQLVGYQCSDCSIKLYADFWMALWHSCANCLHNLLWESWSHITLQRTWKK